MATIQTKERLLLTCVWRAMKARCYNSNTRQYLDYGGRGISVCDKWQRLKGFLEDMQPTYSEGLSLDRIDNNGNYCKENCRWATRREQGNNTRRNVFHKFDGKEMTLSQWAEELKINRSTIAQRFYVYRWPLSRCLTRK